MEDLPMNDTSPDKLKEPIEYFADLTSDAAADHQPKEREQSMDDSGPSTPAHDMDPLEDSDEIRVIKPYDIEEPDDELETSLPRVDRLCLPDRFERWQRDLTDYLNDMGYEPDGSNSNTIPSARKRGQKRKPAHNTLATQQCYPFFAQGHASAETQPEVHEHRPKRQRFSEIPKWHAQDIDSFGAFREANENESSGSETASIDLNGNDPMNNWPIADEMDID
ncbi:uncharacterized protein N7518_003096 [Penicillium psychrosexuale]|uniref:uncharacterized protein n=1 Tax=Penicillium psychrosexuale TaxID=1002107 RepID=UPI0025453989|nr:uncharacterized protein N7518_003096 [Penicillium psychrosexuale]KAJ5801028.1 hypothetical protein N7518_003096 [Penicillium psychrosexuale]